MIESAEDRLAGNTPVNENTEGLLTVEITCVEIPHDVSKPLREVTFSIPVQSLETKGDVVMERLKPFFGGSLSNSDSNSKVDLSLFHKQAAQHLVSSTTTGTVSEAALEKVAQQGSVESFSLVHPTPSNKFTGINVYLDEIGMLKRLPLNSRASEYAAKAGFNPPPQFYGNVYLGRVQSSPKVRCMPFQLGIDTHIDTAEWLKKATMGNLEYQTAMNNITGRQNETQANVDGTDGVSKQEKGGLYAWTQTDEEVEIVVPLPKDATAKEINVKYLSKSVQIKFRKESLLRLDLFARVDPDGCMWTLDKVNTKKERNLVVTLEKGEATSWPRITH